jgi:hypothetical protein
VLYVNRFHQLAKHRGLEVRRSRTLTLFRRARPLKRLVPPVLVPALFQQPHATA